MLLTPHAQNDTGSSPRRGTRWIRRNAVARVRYLALGVTLMLVFPPVLIPFFEGGNSLLAGSCDADGMPQVARAVGLRVAADRLSFTLFLPEGPAARTLCALSAIPRIALTCSEPPTHRTVQVKGQVLGLRTPTQAEEAWVRSYPERFADIVTQVGLTRATALRLHVWPARAVDVAVTELFDQSPGPKAGAPFDAERFLARKGTHA